MYTIYHYARCSKPRVALSLIHRSEIDANVVEYTKEPLATPDLLDMLRKLCLNLRGLIRTAVRDFKTLGLSKQNLIGDYLVDTMIHHPKLIERPIIVRGEKAVIGRPAEEIFKLVK